MKPTRIVRMVLGASVVLVASAAWAQTAGSAFTYQGQLKEGGMPANGVYDFQFTLYDERGAAVSGPFDVEDEPVSNGLFGVVVDFEKSLFTGDARWLEIGVRPGNSTDRFETLSPRQELTPTPYATTALNAVGVDGHSLDASDGSPVDALYVDNAGQVGVGTDRPGTKLDVIGMVRSTSGGFEFPDGTVQTTAQRTGPAGPPGADGRACWDLNGNGVCEREEDVVLDGVCDALDCRGADGPAGAPGPQGDNGLACWDLNGNGACDREEDVVLDGVCNTLDCKGADGAAGAAGRPGADGLPCWDLNGNGICEREEDVVFDGVCNALDCRGADGAAGAPGAPGATGPPGDDGISCWDLNQNGRCDADTEDVDGDRVCTVADCNAGMGFWLPGERGDIYYSGGNVGIGTSTPDASLDVAGGIAVDGFQMGGRGRVSAGDVLTADENGVGTWETPSSSSDPVWSTSGTNVYYNDGNVGIGTSAPDHALHVTASSGTGIAGHTTDATSTNDGVYGEAAGFFGQGVHGLATGDSGRGVFGEVTGTYGHGVYGQAVSGVGVYGKSTNATGVFGHAYSPGAAAVYGGNNADNGDAIGVKGESVSPDGYGGYFLGRGYFSGNVGIGVLAGLTPLKVVRASGTGAGPAITGTASGNSVTGVYGSVSDPAESCWGVRGDSSSPIGVGVQGKATAQSGANAGVLGQSSSSEGYGIHGRNFVGGWAGYFQGLTYISARLGIGTDDPDEPLHVDGTAKMTGFQLTTGASNGYVLTSDASGVGTWQQATGGGSFDLPYDGTISDSGPAFDITNTGTGMGAHAIRGAITNSSSSADAAAGYFTATGTGGKALIARGDSGAVVHVTHSGSVGNAVYATSSSSSTTVVARNSGSGDVIEGKVSNNTVFRVANDGITYVDILTIEGGADLAEPFDVTGGVAAAEPGMLVSIDPHNVGKLAVSDSAYDCKVAGVISGAGGIKPGMLMGQTGSIAHGEHPIALTGRVWTLCDTSVEPIEPGDLLTTSDTPGHAMKVTDTARAQGAVIGKAMSRLAKGERGLVLVLVNLQ
ncbi:MAG: hypothetical protein ACYTFA_04760 [Planctomycetota bacterium]